MDFDFISIISSIVLLGASERSEDQSDSLPIPIISILANRLPDQIPTLNPSLVIQLLQVLATRCSLADLGPSFPDAMLRKVEAADFLVVLNYLTDAEHEMFACILRSIDITMCSRSAAHADLDDIESSADDTAALTASSAADSTTALTASSAADGTTALTASSAAVDAPITLPDDQIAVAHPAFTIKKDHFMAGDSPTSHQHPSTIPKINEESNLFAEFFMPGMEVLVDSPWSKVSYGCRQPI